MDLITLDSSNQPARPVEGYDSLIWTERYNTVGDFQATFGDVAYGLGVLKEGLCVSLRESTVPMIVETHTVERKKNSGAKLNVTGRSFESILDRRVAVPSVEALASNAPWTVDVKTPSDLAYYIVYKVCVEGLVDPADIFPGTQVQFPTPLDYLMSTGPVKAFEATRGNLLQTVLTLLQTEILEDTTTTPVTPKVEPHGIRGIRPNQAGTANAIEIYAGRDLSNTIRFDGTRELLDDGTYLFSKVGSANVTYGVALGIHGTMYKGSSVPTGLNRRVVLTDASESGSSDAEVLRNHMIATLSGARETAIFDGSINQDISPYVYGVDYRLGDIVRVIGDYGLDTKARVTEYIRVADASGYKAYPTLTTIVE